MVLVAEDDADQIVVVRGVDKENPGVANAGKHLWSDRQTCPAVHLGGGGDLLGDKAYRISSLSGRRFYP